MMRPVLCLLALCVLAACGQKGPLFLPEPAVVKPSENAPPVEITSDEVTPGEESLDEVPGAKEIPEDLLTP